MAEVKSLHCHRTREWLSVALDTQLSQFESALVAAHVERCAECAAFAHDLAAVTQTLRGSSEAPLRRPISVPRRWRRSWAAPLRAGSAVAATVAVVFAAVLVPAPSSVVPPKERALLGASLQSTPTMNDLVVEVHRPALSKDSHGTLAFGTGGIGAVKPLLSPIPG